MCLDAKCRLEKCYNGWPLWFCVISFIELILKSINNIKVGENFMGIASLLEETGGGNKCAISISPAGPYTPGLALIRHLF